MVDLFFGINALTWFVGSFTLVAGVIGVSNIMLVIVKERTHEIGIRRAIGATPLTVVGQIMMESIILTTAAGYAGLVCGHLFPGGGRQRSQKNRRQDGHVSKSGSRSIIALTALCILVFCGAVAGLVPGVRALSMKPVEAIRTQ